MDLKERARTQVLRAVEGVRPTKYGYRSKAKDWICPHCYAKPGKSCVRPSGRECPTHEKRFNEATSYQILTCLWP